MESVGEKWVRARVEVSRVTNWVRPGKRLRCWHGVGFRSKNASVIWHWLGLGLSRYGSVVVQAMACLEILQIGVVLRRGGTRKDLGLASQLCKR